MPSSAITLTNARPPTKERVLPRSTPMTAGMMMPARLAKRLNMPVVRPRRFGGARSVMSVQPRLHMPCPKNTNEKTPITAVMSCRKPASSSVLAMASPVTRGALRPMVAEPVRRISQSDHQPPKTSPTDAAMGQGGEDPRARELQVLRRSEVGRVPGEEEHQRRVARELAETGAEKSAVAEQ